VVSWQSPVGLGSTDTDVRPIAPGRGQDEGILSAFSGEIKGAAAIPPDPVGAQPLVRLELLLVWLCAEPAVFRLP